MTNNIPAHLRDFVLETPAVSGKMVCQGHADVCAIIGHSTYTMIYRDGTREVSPYCPRCGAAR